LKEKKIGFDLLLLALKARGQEILFFFSAMCEVPSIKL
jgi:hypothetical protein